MANKLELLVDIPDGKKKKKRQQYEKLGYKVVLKQQGSGKWSLAAAK